ncbi:MAG: phosphorylase [Burkholderia sp.]
MATQTPQAPVIAVTGMAFEAKIARGQGVETVYVARAGRLESALSEAVERGCSGIISFGTAGGLAPDLAPGALVIAEAIDGPFGEVRTDAGWNRRLVAALRGTPVVPNLRLGRIAAVGAPVVDAQQKAALHARHGALAVDMESHIAGAFAAARGVPFAVCRVIVDPSWRTLPSAATAGLRDDGTTTILPILRELAKQPSQLGALLKLAGDARAAKTTLIQARHAFEREGAWRGV